MLLMIHLGTLTWFLHCFTNNRQVLSIIITFDDVSTNSIPGLGVPISPLKTLRVTYYRRVHDNDALPLKFSEH